MSVLTLILVSVPLLVSSADRSKEELPSLYDGPIFSSSLYVDSEGGIHVVYDRDVISDTGEPLADEVFYLYQRYGSEDWIGPINVSNSPGMSTYPKVVADRGCAPWIFWLEDLGDTTHRTLKRTDYFWSRGDGISFTPPLSLFHSPTQPTMLSYGEPYIDQVGRPCLIFPANIPPDYNNVRFTYYENGFDTPTLLPIHGSYFAPIPLDGERLYLGFIGAPLRNTGSNAVLYVVLDPYTGEIERGPEEIYSDRSKMAFELNLILCNGVYYAVWDEDTTGDLLPDRILTTRSQDGMIWEEPYEVPYEPGNFYELDMAGDSLGNIHLIASYSSSEGVTKILYYRFAQNYGWDEPVVLDSCKDDGICEAPSMFVRDGWVYALWTRKKRHGDNLQYRLIFTKFFPTSVEEDKTDNGNIIDVSPTVFSDYLLIESATSSPSPLSMTIYNSEGREVWQGEGKEKIRWNGVDLMGRELPQGVYFLRTAQGNKSELVKVVKLKR